MEIENWVKDWEGVKAGSGEDVTWGKVLHGRIGVGEKDEECFGRGLKSSRLGEVCKLKNLFGDKVGQIFGDVRDGNNSDDGLLNKDKEVFGDIHWKIREGYW